MCKSGKNAKKIRQNNALQRKSIPNFNTTQRLLACWVVLKFGIGFCPRVKTNTKFQYHPVTKEKFRETNAICQNSVKIFKMCENASVSRKMLVISCFYVNLTENL